MATERQGLSRALAAVGCASVIAACGGSHHQASSTATRTGAAPIPAQTRSTNAAPVPTATAASRSGTTKGSPTQGARNVRLPATFTLEPGGSLSPSSVTSPAFVAIDLTVTNRDSRTHRVLVKAPGARTLTVAASARASETIRGLRAGRYALAVDGVARGALITGGEPGP